MGEQQLNELKRIMGTVDGRDFLYNFVLFSCGVDYSSGIPSGLTSEYLTGVKKPAIDLFNLLVYHCYDNFKLMLQEQELRRNSNG
jgi:hypothetical protein